MLLAAVVLTAVITAGCLLLPRGFAQMAQMLGGMAVPAAAAWTA